MSRWLLALLLLLPVHVSAQTGNLSGASVTATGSTAARTLADRAADVTNVLSFTGCDITGVSNSTACIQAAANAIPTSGGILFFPPGTYSTNNEILLKSGTTVYGPGARIVPVAVGSFTPLTSAPIFGGTFYAIFANTNWAAGSLTDHDITVEDIALGPISASWNAEGVLMRMASHITVDNVVFQGMSSSTAFLATNDTLVQNSHSTNHVNVCWDHWEAPANAVVRNNYCSTVSGLYGIVFTGANTTSTSAGVADHIVAEGNTITGVTGAGIWLQGVGAAGSGSSHAVLSDNYISMGTGGNSCVKVSGASVDNLISSTHCLNPTHEAFVDTSDSGGTPSRTHFVGGIVEGANLSGLNLVQMSGTDGIVEGVQATSGTYTFGIQLAGTRNTAKLNQIAAGSSGIYSLVGTAPHVFDPLVPIAWTPTFNFGGAHTGMTYSSQAGQYYLNGSQVRACFQLALSALGSSTGSATIDALPVASAAGLSTQTSLDINYNGLGSGAGAFLFVGSNSTSLAIFAANNGGVQLSNTSFGASTSMNGCFQYQIN